MDVCCHCVRSVCEFCIACLAAAEAFPCKSGVDAVIEVQFESSPQTWVGQRPRLPGLGGLKFRGFRVVPVHSKLHPCGDAKSDRCTASMLDGSSQAGGVPVSERIMEICYIRRYCEGDARLPSDSDRDCALYAVVADGRKFSISRLDSF